LIHGNQTIDACNANVILDGSGTVGGSVGLLVDSDSNTVKGIQILHFPANGMLLTINANHNIIGGDRTVGTGPNGEGNLISANGLSSGLEIYGSDNVVQGNLIGTDVSGYPALGNTGIGVELKGTRNVVGGMAAGTRNVIGYNGDGGIHVQGSAATGNTITRNSITNNVGKGIELSGGGNIELASPAITSYTATLVSGTALPYCAVEIFSDPEDEGKVYEGTATSDSTGVFTFIKPEGVTGPNVTATATDTAGNTSQFSAQVSVGVESDKSKRLPTRYELFQNYPNPFNASSEIRYQIPEDDHVTLKIFNTLGQEVRTLVNAEQKSGEYVVKWHGRDDSGKEVASGLYFCRLKANKFDKTIKMLLLR
jgi:hypothetical protein